MRYLKKINETQYHLCNEGDKEIEVRFNDIKIAKGTGSFDLEIKSDVINPVVELNYEDGTKEIAGVQHLEDIGIINFRDIGGYVTEEGKQIKYQQFYRSAVVSSKKEDMARLVSLNIKTILDFRSSWEVNEEPDVIVHNTTYIHKSAMKAMDEMAKSSKSLNIADLEKKFVDNDPVKMMKELYKDLIFNNEAYKELFELIEQDKTPLLFHCSAGKDRTGIAAALIMLALGVDRKQIEEEYLLTNIYRKPLIEEFAKEKQISFEEAQSVVGVNKEYLDLFFTMILERHSTTDEYLEVEYGLTKQKREELKSRYTI